MLVTFASVGEAGRPVAGVATAAQIVHTLALAGHDRIWLAVPGGGPLTERAEEDLRRLSNGTTVDVVEGNAPGEARIERKAVEGLEVIAAPRLTSRDPQGDRQGERRPGLQVAQPAGLAAYLRAAVVSLPGIRPVHATIGTVLLAVAMFAALLLGGARV